MNILIPDRWLREHLDTNAKPADIQRCLSLSGPSVERIETIEKEPVYDIEVTTNRVDAMSIRGIAREAVAILPEFGFTASLKPLSVSTTQSSTPLDLKITNQPKLVPKILAVKLTVTNNSASPRALQKKLLQIGQRPINVLVDITNYVMWELGHPIHAFDYDSLSTKKIITRLAKPKETFVSLDGITHHTVGGEVVFDDGTGTIIDLPGIIGTANTAITDSTTSMLLWIEHVDSNKIRFASITHNIRTQAAVLNEKTIDPNLADTSLSRAILLYQKYAKAHVASEVYSHQSPTTLPKPVRLTQAKLTTYLGQQPSSSRVKTILNNLGCSVDYSPKTKTFTVTPPTLRVSDLTTPEDIIEEIARIIGYHNLDSLLPATQLPQTSSNFNQHLEDNIKSTLTALGGFEVYTHSLISKTQAHASNFPLSSHLAIKNPLSDDQTHLRRSLIASLTEIITDNAPKIPFVFELANTYHPTKKSHPTHQLELGLASLLPLDQLNGILLTLLSRLHLIKLSFNRATSTTKFPEFVPANSTIIKTGSTPIAMAGKLDSNLSIAKIIIADLLPVFKLHPTFKPISQFTPIIEDLTFTLPSTALQGEIIHSLLQLPHVTSVHVTSTYQANTTFRFHYTDPLTQLTAAHAAKIRANITSHLQKNFHAKLVGSLT